MLKNYLVTALRNILRHKGFSIINIAGLAIALTVCIIILLSSIYELTYDSYLPNYERIYRVNTEFHLSAETERYQSSPEPTGPTLKELFPEITHNCHFYGSTGLMKYEDKTFMEYNLVFTDPDFLKMFSIEAIHGDINTMLDDPYAIVLTESMAKKYFGETDPVGEVIRRNDIRDYTVTGVIRDFPKNASYEFDFLMSVNLFQELNLGFVGNWGNISGQTMIMTAPDVDIDALGEKIWSVPKELNPDQDVCNLWLQPLSKIHLYDLDGGGAIQFIYIFLVVGLIVLIIASINFMNLSTARSSLRAKEVGIRKVMGAQRRELVRQFYCESLLLAAIAMLLAIFSARLIIASADRFAVINEAINQLWDMNFTLLLTGITLFTGLFAGSYPAFVLSGFKPITILKGAFSKGRTGKIFRSILVVIQFSLSIALMISTLIVFKQMNFMKEKDLGFNKDNLLYLPIKGELNDKFAEFKEELLQISGIENVTRCSSSLSNIGFVASDLDWEGRSEEDNPIFSFECVDYGYFATCQMEFVAGRGYSEKFANDTENYILNETAIKRIDYTNDNAVGRMFDMWGRRGKIIGVVKDFNFQHQSMEIDPLILTDIPDYFNYILIRADEGTKHELTGAIKEKWEAYVSQFPFDYNFMDEDFEKLYKFEDDMGYLFKVFTALAVFISCLGLFGLATYVVERRTREIGIRKVLGASVSGLIRLLISDFTKWVIISNIIAMPLAWFAMHKWLENYASKTDVSWTIYAGAGISALMIAFITVFFHTYHAASANPVNSIKYE
ncbi:MAG: ABC transporter permease [Candidatus Cloacimonetes bacterium]|nr:ABC transporter permease [Candidatus Cloacimonadota bacterium]